MSVHKARFVSKVRLPVAQMRRVCKGLSVKNPFGALLTVGRVTFKHPY